MYPASSKGLNKETEDSIYFFTVPFEPLNNFSAHIVHVWNKNFPTVEHAFQWKKFSLVQPEIANRILSAKSAHAVKEISDANKDKQPTDWHEQRVAVMEEILKAKVQQHKDVQDALERTHKRKIIENSPVDSFWGIGSNKDGKNMLGKTWMKIRDNN
jgi:N-glycosidase YbiA